MAKKKKNSNVANLAFKFYIMPDSEQQVFFAKTFGCCRKIYNLILADKIAYYQKYKESISLSVIREGSF